MRRNTDDGRTFCEKNEKPKRANSQGSFGFANFESLKNREQVTIVGMFFAILGMRILTWMFFVGLVGSAVVVLISFWEDGKELFGKD